MNKNNYAYLVYIILTLFFIFLLIINQYLFGYILYCDSNISSNDIVEVLNCDNKSQEEVYHNSYISCFTTFNYYKNIAKRKSL